ETDFGRGSLGSQCGGWTGNTVFERLYIRLEQMNSRTQGKRMGGGKNHVEVEVTQPIPPDEGILSGGGRHGDGGRGSGGVTDNTEQAREIPHGVGAKAGVAIVHIDLPPLFHLVGEALIHNVVRFNYGVTCALAHSVWRKGAGTVWGGAVVRLVQSGRPLIAVIDVAAAPIKLGKRLPREGKLADGSREAPVLGLREVGEWFLGRAGNGIDAQLGRTHIIQVQELRERLVAEVVVEGPGVKRVVDPAGEAIGVIVDGRVQIIRVGSCEGAKIGRRIEEIQRLGREGGAAVRGAVVVEVEA